ncbi:MAG: Helix-turn-helix domain [Firmicutes bacterium]|nr:Helix-turn-helix domain [Bacillota bacterium]
MPVERLLTVQDLTEILKVSDETVYRMVRENQIPFRKIRRQIRFIGWQITKWLDEEKQG